MTRTASFTFLLLVAGSSAAAACSLPGETGRALHWQRPLPAGLGQKSNGFGVRRHPVLSIDRPHNGIDWSGAIGTAILAAAPGRIVAAGRAGEFGTQIRIDHGGGWQTTYSHLQRTEASAVVGACVSVGDQIGRLGSTGLSSEPHLHFELQRDGDAVDPANQGNGPAD